MTDVHQQVIGEVDVQASIDRLTALGKTKYIDLFEQHLRLSPVVKRVSQAPYPYRTSFTTSDGSYIAISGDDVKGMPNVRIDFNPNKLSEEGEKAIRDFVSRLTRRRLSRVDVAIDYFGVDMAALEWHEYPRERQRTVHSAPSGRLETLYLGSFKSDKLIRIYDKGKEQKVEFDWWRVESQARMGRGDRLFADNPFDGLYANEKGSEYLQIPLEERATMIYLEHHPEAIAQLTKYKRQRYREMMQANERKFSPTPAEVFEKEKGYLQEQIAGWLQATV